MSDTTTPIPIDTRVRMRNVPWRAGTVVASSADGVRVAWDPIESPEQDTYTEQELWAPGALDVLPASPVSRRLAAGAVCLNTRALTRDGLPSSMVILVDTATPRRWWRPTGEGDGDFHVDHRASSAAPMGPNWVGILAVEHPYRWGLGDADRDDVDRAARWLKANIRTRIGPAEGHVLLHDIEEEFEQPCVWTIVDPAELTPYC